MSRFETIEISGDAGLRIYADNLTELFVNAALGMYSLITENELIGEEKEIEVSAESGSLEGLIVAWLNELIFHFDADGFLAKKVRILDFSPDRAGRAESGDYSIRASLMGEEYDQAKHKGELLLKAATYHRLAVGKTDGQWKAEVIFDI